MDSVAVATNIKRVSCEGESYEVGTDNIISIETSNQGSKKLNMYKINYGDGTSLFFGVFEHEVEYMEE